MFSFMINSINSGILDKKYYHEFLNNKDIELRDFLDAIGYEYDEKDYVNLYKVNEDVRLKEAQDKLNMITNNPASAIGEYNKYLHGILENFLSIYYLGWIKKFNMSEYGTIAVEIVPTLSMNSYTSNPVSDKLKFENKIEKLTSMGLDVIDSDYGNSKTFIDNDKNRDLISNMLSERGARLLEFRSIRGHLDSFSFKIKHFDVNNFKEEKNETVYVITDQLNADEIENVKKLIKDLNSTIGYANQMVSTCGNLIESYFAEMCKIFDFDGQIRKTIEIRHQDARTKNNKIREIEASIGSAFPVEEVENGLKKVYNKLENFATSKIGFVCSNFKINQYGFIEASLRASEGYYYGEGELIDPKEFNSLFETKRSREDLYYVMNTEDNVHKLNLILTNNIPSADIEEVIVRKLESQFIVNEIKISVRNMIDLAE